MGSDNRTFILGEGNGFGSYPVAPVMPAYGAGGCGNGWGGDGIWALFIAALFGGWGRGGFGGDAGGANLVASEANTNLLQQAILNNQEAVRDLAGMMNVNENAINQAVCSVKDKIGNVECTMAINNGNTIHALDSAARDIISSQKDCCCETQKNLLSMGYEDRIAILNQTNSLTQTITQGNLALGCKLDAINQNINDKFCQLEITQLKRDVDHYRTVNQDLRFQISQDRQTAFLYNAINGSGSSNTTTPA